VGAHTGVNLRGRYLTPNISLANPANPEGGRYVNIIQVIRGFRWREVPASKDNSIPVCTEGKDMDIKIHKVNNPKVRGGNIMPEDKVDWLYPWQAGV